MFEKVNRNTVAAQIIEQIKELLHNEVLRPGDRLPSERQMAEQFSVSRPTVREALRALEHAGVLQTRVGEGVFVASGNTILANGLQLSHILSHYTLQEMVETRRVVEDATVRFALLRGEPEDFENLEKIHAASVLAVNDTDEFVRLDYAFHSAIAEAAHNGILFDMLQSMGQMMTAANLKVVSTPENCADIVKQHAALLEAMRNRDLEAAHRIVQAHLDEVERDLRLQSGANLEDRKLPLAGG